MKKNSLSKNSLFNMMGTAIPLTIGALTLPYLMRTLGPEKFGILTILWSLIGYFSLFDLGLGRAITMLASKALATNKTEDSDKIIRIGIEFTLLIGIIGGIALYFAAPLLAQKVLNVSPSLINDTEEALRIAAWGIPLSTLTSGFRGALEAHERFFESNVAKIILGILLFLFPIIGIYIVNDSISILANSLILARLISSLMYLYFVKHYLFAKGRTIQRDLSEIKRLFTISSWIAISNMISPLLVSADRFIISHFLGASQVVYYTVPLEFITRLLIIPSAIGTALLPHLSKSYSLTVADADNVYSKYFKINFIILIVLTSLGALLSYPILQLFFSAEFAEKSTLIAVLLCAGVLINGIAYMPYTALHSKNKVKLVAAMHIGELFIYFPLLILLIHLYGLAGAAAAWVVRVAIDYVGLHTLNRRSPIS